MAGSEQERNLDRSKDFLVGTGTVVAHQMLVAVLSCTSGVAAPSLVKMARQTGTCCSWEGARKASDLHLETEVLPDGLVRATAAVPREAASRGHVLTCPRRCS